MGTVLHLDCEPSRISTARRFSPLLDGDGVASLRFDGNAVALIAGFSPLLDGDGVASSMHARCIGTQHCLFQSPSRWGRCCICIESRACCGRPAVSVPFSMGTVLHLCSHARCRDTCSVVSVPFSMGTVLLCRLRRDTRADRDVSVPFSMGTVLLPRAMPPASDRLHGFSPLLDGDGVASAMRTDSTGVGHAFQSPSRWGRCCFCCRQSGARRHVSRFSPLLDGDGVASTAYRLPDMCLDTFQSPSRWGRCCFHCATYPAVA